MSRVEPKENREEQPRREAQIDDRKMDRTPGKAEGEERDVEEALRHQEDGGRP
jgi:hypothetical protein